LFRFLLGQVFLLILLMIRSAFVPSRGWQISL
jgi:hypothetical protein